MAGRGIKCQGVNEYRLFKPSLETSWTMYHYLVMPVRRRIKGRAEILLDSTIKA
jgi:hypothetical protein